MNSNTTVIWNKFSSELYKYVLSKVKDEDTAKDILQDSFIKVHQKIGYLSNEKSLKFWIYSIVRNSTIDYFRTRKYNFEIDDKYFKEEEVLKDKTSELASCILPFINCLPEKYKEALTLTEFENYSQLELAKHLGISYSGAKSRVQRAKIKLRELFEQCCNISSDNYGNIMDYQARNKKDCC